MASVGRERISKREFYMRGGFSNPNLFRKHNGRSWEYYRVIDWYLR